MLHGRGETRCRFAESDNYFISNINDIHIQDTSFYCRIILYQYHDVSCKAINMYFLKIVKLFQYSFLALKKCHGDYYYRFCISFLATFVILLIH